MMPRRIYVRMGNRGGALAILGTLWLLVGDGLLTAPPPRTVGLADEDWPMWARALLWLIPGAVALSVAIARALGGAWHYRALRADAWAWGALVVPLSTAVAVRGWAAANGAYPGAWLGTLIYAGLGVLIYFCARGLDRPPPLPRLPRRHMPGAP